MLKDGLYEQLINNSLKQEISASNAKDIDIRTSDFDSENSPEILSQYVANILKNRLVKLAELHKSEDGIQKQLETTNQILSAIQAKSEEKDALGVAGSLFIAGVMIYMGSEMVSSLTDPHYADDIYKGKTPEEQMAELNQYRQQKEKEQEEQKQLEADKLAAEKAYANTQLDRWENGEIDAYENDINYWNSIVHQ